MADNNIAQTPSRDRFFFNDGDLKKMKPVLGEGFYKRYKDSTGKETPPNYPSIFTEPSLKQTKEYALENAMALYYNNWYTWQNAFGNSYRQRFIDNRNWSNGKQDVHAFIGGKPAKQDKQQNPLMKQLDFDPVTEQSKYRDIVVGYLEDLDYDVIASSINPIAAATKENKRLNEIVMLRQKKTGFTNQVNQAAGQNIMPESNLPFPVNDEKEINLYYQLGGAKEMFELEIELSNQIVLNDSDWSQIKKMLLEDTFDTGIIAVDTSYDRDGRIRIKYCDPVNIGVEDYRGHFLNRPDRIWYMELKTIQEIYMDGEGQFSHKDLQMLAKTYEGMFGNPGWTAAYNGYNQYFNTDSNYNYAGFGSFFYTWKIPVMHSRISEVDMYEIIHYTNTNGFRVQTFKQGINNAGHAMSDTEFLQTLANGGIFAPAGESYDDTGNMVSGLGGDIYTERLQIHRYYQSSWIVNTQYVYNYGRTPMPARDPYNPRFELCPLKYYRITQQPYAERIRPWVKKIYNTCLKMDAELAHHRPSGHAINIKALENIALGNGETLTVKHQIEILNQTGDMLYADEGSGDLIGVTKGKRIIDPIANNGFKEAMETYIEYINFCLSRIVSLTGLNEYMDASNPNPNTPVALAQSAQRGTKNSLSQISSGFLFLAEKIALDVSERVRKCVELTGNYSGYADAIGSGMLQFITVTPNVVPHRFAIKVVAKATAAEKDSLRQHIYQAFSNLANTEQGGLWAVDVLRFDEYINAGVPFKLIRLMLAGVLEDRMNKAQQQKLQLIQQQVQGNQQQAQTALQTELSQEQEKIRLQMVFESFMTGEIAKRNQSMANAKGNVKLITDANHSNLKRQESMFQAGGES